MVALGSAIASIEFSGAEKDRIAGSLARAEGLPYEVLTRHASSIHDNAFWARQYKTFNITGFRPVQPSASSLVLKRALGLAKSLNGSNVPKIWALYRNCAINYIVGELKELDELLLHEELQDVEGSLTLKIFTSIRRAAALYKVPIEQIKALYEIWGFERIEGFDKLFESDLIDAGIVSRLIEKQTGKLRSELLGTHKTLSLRCGEFSHDLETTRRQLDRLIEHTALVDNSISKMSGEIEDIRVAVKNIEFRPRNKDSRSRVTDSETSTNTTKVPQAGYEEFRSLQTSLGQNTKRLAKLESVVATLQSTELAHTQVQIRKAVSTNFLETVAACVAYLSNLGAESVSRGVIALYVELLKHSRVLISQRPQLLLELCSRLWGYEIRQIAASPLWTSSSDWREAFNFIAHTDGNARGLVINDFDVGIQEAYLVPTLIEWQSAVHENSVSRIFLVASSRDSPSVSPRVLELATYVPSESDFHKELDRICPSTDSVATDSLVEKVGHDLSNFVVHTNYKYQEEISKMAEISGFELPERLAANFVNMYSGLAGVIPPSGATLLAASLSLLPWIHETRGESSRRAFHDRLKIVFGAA